VRGTQYEGQPPLAGHDDDGAGHDSGRIVSQSLYLVRSAQASNQRQYGHYRRRSGSSGAQPSPGRYISDVTNQYIVWLDPWNCSCAAFAFSAFPASLSGNLETEYHVQRSYGDLKGSAEEDEWSFGGLSADGTANGAENAPCCKHLLACVLAERCGAVFGGYVKAVEVGREEMAGLAANV
jgi:hypothetical protein